VASALNHLYSAYHLIKLTELQISQVSKVQSGILVATKKDHSFVVTVHVEENKSTVKNLKAAKTC